jgi:hypothetical protein
MNKDDIDDAQFDAFLNGKDELSRRLRAMPQALPPAALDDAILRHVQQDLEAQARPPAANDPAPTPGYPKKLSWRWRLPAALAATVLVGLFAKQSFDASQSLRTVAVPREEQAVETKIIEEVAPPPPKSEQVPMAAAPAPAEILIEPPAAPAPLAAPVPAEPPLAKDRRAARSEDEAASGAAAAAAPPAPVAQANATAPAAQASAPAYRLSNGVLADKALDVGAAEARKQSAQRYAPEQKIDSVQITGQRVRADPAYSMNVPTSTVASQAERSNLLPAPKDWLERIEALLRDGQNDKAVAEWAKFRASYPDYPVPDTTSERIRAIPQP